MKTSGSSIPLLIASLSLASMLPSCSSTTGGPNTPTANGGQGRIVYMTGGPTSSSVIVTDSMGTASTTLGAGYVWSVANNRIVWDSTGGHDLDDGQGDAAIIISTNNGTSSTVWKSSSNERLGSMPVVSPDGSRITFITEQNTSNTEHLHVYEVSSSGNAIANDHVVDSNMHDKIMPVFSPDGSKLAYYSHSGSSQFLTIRQSDGTLIANIPDGQDQGNLPGNVEWSPSGDKIAFGGDGVVRVVDADGGNPIAIDSGGDPDWSPDGKTLAYETPYFSGNVYTNIVLTSDFGATKNTLPNPNMELRIFPRWSPDGTKLLFSEESKTGPLGLEVIDVASGVSKIVAPMGARGVWLR